MKNQLQEKMHKHVEAWHNSGLTKKAYAQSQGMSRYQFEYWIRKFSDTPTENKQMDFIEIAQSTKTNIKETIPNQSEQSSSPRIVLTLPGGITLQIFG